MSDARNYLLSEYYRAWALLHQGRWGEMLRIVGEGAAGLEMAERNEHRRWAVLFRLELAWLHEQAFDFERARELSEKAHEEARKIAHPYTETLSLILLGMAHLGLERREAAFRCFSEVTARLDRERSLMDWILRIPLHYGLSRYWLAQGELAQARRDAEALYRLATAPGERTYLSLSLQTLAEIAMAAQDWREAEAAVARSLAALEGAEAPLAAWRVCATAGRLYDRLGRTTEAAGHWRRSAETLTQLATSLGGADRLRQTMGDNPAAQSILRRAYSPQY
jgi:tetratricopeptide (TPR) repeat protein